jgi:hypothetical protein
MNGNQPSKLKDLLTTMRTDKTNKIVIEISINRQSIKSTYELHESVSIPFSILDEIERVQSELITHVIKNQE